MAYSVSVHKDIEFPAIASSYAKASVHWLDHQNIQLISIMTTNGHEKAKTSFMVELERRAEEFQNS